MLTMPSAAAHAAIEEVAREMADEVQDISRDLTDEIHAKIADIDDDLHTRTLASTRSNVGMIFAMLSEQTPPAMATPPLEALAYVREYVRRGLELEVLLRAYRTGQARFSHLWLERLQTRAEGAEELAETFGYVNDWVFAWVEAIEFRLTEYYMGERMRGMRGATAARVEEVRAILEGRSVDEARASARLRYELRRNHLAYVIWTDNVEGEAGHAGRSFGEMERLAAEIAEAVGAVDHLAVPLGDYLSCWAGLRGEPELDALTPTLPAAAQWGLSVAVGQAASRLDGFRRSHEEALQTRRVLRLEPFEEGACARFSNMALDALMTQDMREARRFVRRELGCLAEDTVTARRMRETLVTFLEENGSFLHAAQKLGVHENTVAYRIRRAEELLERQVKERQLELRAALRIARLTIPR
jgi:hypothetical protein